MNLLFRQNASFKEKVFTIFGMVSTIAAIYAMLTTNNIPNEFISRWWLLISFIVSIFYFMPFLRDRHPSNKLRTFAFPRKVFFYTFIYVFMFSVSYLLVVRFIPDVTSRLLGKPYEFQAIVESKHRGGKGCRYWIKPVGISYGFTSSVCINKNLWNDLKSGDQVLITGSKSFLGINVLQVVANKSPS